MLEKVELYIFCKLALNVCVMKRYLQIKVCDLIVIIEIIDNYTIISNVKCIIYN